MKASWFAAGIVVGTVSPSVAAPVRAWSLPLTTHPMDFPPSNPCHGSRACRSYVLQHIRSIMFRQWLCAVLSPRRMPAQDAAGSDST